jgi:hypothetical protein
MLRRSCREQQHVGNEPACLLEGPAFERYERRVVDRGDCCSRSGNPVVGDGRAERSNDPPCRVEDRRERGLRRRCSVGPQRVELAELTSMVTDPGDRRDDVLMLGVSGWL